MFQRSFIFLGSLQFFQPTQSCTNMYPLQITFFYFSVGIVNICNICNLIAKMEEPNK